MLDPETAHILQESGVKLNDTPNEVQTKLSDYSYRQDRINKINEMADYEYLATDAQVNLKPDNEIVTILDSRGNPMRFWRKPEEDDDEDDEVKIYTDKNIPPSLRQDLIDTLTDEEGLKTFGKPLELTDLMRMFPNVERNTLQDYLDRFLVEVEYEKPEGEKKWWQFWK